MRHTDADLIKGEIAKPGDSLQDFVIVRSDGTPVFHLANVVDDIENKFAQHRAHARQMNDVVDDKITK